MHVTQSTWTVAVGVLLGLPAAASGAQVVVYDGGAPAGASGWNYAGGAREAERLTLVNTSTFDAVRFWTVVSTGQQLGGESVTWALWSSAGALPGVVLATGQASPQYTPLGPVGPPAAFMSSHQSDLVIPQQTLVGGTYWLSLASASLPNLFWQTTGPGDLFSLSGSVGGPWTPNPVDLAFQLRASAPITAIPEPSVVALHAGALLLVLATAAWKRGARRDPRRP